MKTKEPNPTRASLFASSILSLCLAGLSVTAAPPGPDPQVPAGGGPPGPFPNTQVSGVNVVARGGSAFNGNVEIAAFEGNGPIPWTINRYNRGDYAMRLSPANSAAANANTLNKGFIDFPGGNDASLAENQSWRPHPALGVVIPTVRQNGPIDWGDGAGPFYPTVAIGSGGSSGFGYSMVNGTFGNGDLDVQIGSAGNPPTGSPEANCGFSVAWFPYDQGWLAGNFGNPVVGDPNFLLPDGTAIWNGSGQHSAGLSAGLLRWEQYPPFSGLYGGLAQLRLPGVDAEADGMIFATSANGNSDVNIVGVAPTNDLATGSSGWIITIREDSALTGAEVANSGQFQFEFVYIPYNAQNLIGGHINGATGASLHSAGTFTLTRTGTGTYELTVPGKGGTNGTLLLQVADFEETLDVPMASRAFLSYQYNPANGRFVIQARKATSETVASLVDANFYFTWVDFENPLSPPAGPRLRNLDAVAVTDVNSINASQASVTANTHEPEVLVTTVDVFNTAGYADPTANNNLAQQALIGYYYDPRTLTRTRGPFFIMGNANGVINKHDAKYNPISREYVIVGRAAGAGTSGEAVLMISRIKPHSVAGANEPLVNVFVYSGVNEGLGYDDVSVAVSSQNGNFIVVAERNVTGEGEGAFGALFSSTGAVLTPAAGRLDLRPFSGAGDEDDPDVVYLPQRDVFLYVSNTDNDGLVNKIVGSIVQTTAPGGTLQVSGPEQLLSTGTGTQGHPASIENPFNGEIITAYDFGNGTARGNLSYFNIGAGPSYPFTEARPEIPYLTGTAPNPFRHQHPRLAVDQDRGVFLVAHQAYQSSVGLPNAYVFSVLDGEGAMMPSQLGAPYFLADSYGQIPTGPNDHNLIFDPNSGSFVAVFVATHPQGGFPVAYLASVTVTSSHLATQPTLTIERDGTNIIIRWPASATGFVLKSSPSLTSPSWTGPAGGTPQPDGDFLKVTITSPTGISFYRLEK